MDKQALMKAVLEALAALSEATRASAAVTRKGATHAESRAENDKDTRGLESSYLARGQAMRVEELEESVAKLKFLPLPNLTEHDPITLGALVTLRVDEASATYFLVPVEGGMKIELDGLVVQLISPAAPLGRALLEKQVGDDFVLRVAGREREYEIDSVA